MNVKRPKPEETKLDVRRNGGNLQKKKEKKSQMKKGKDIKKELNKNLRGLLKDTR